MEFEWDEDKAAANIAKHGVPFALATLSFEDKKAVVLEDSRADYGEKRFFNFGRIAERLYVVVFTLRGGGERVRIISARKANKRERAQHDDG